MVLNYLLCVQLHCKYQTLRMPSKTRVWKAKVSIAISIGLVRYTSKAPDDRDLKLVAGRKVNDLQAFFVHQ